MNIKRFTLLTTSSLLLVVGALFINQPVKEKYFPRENTYFKQQQALADGYLEYMKSIKADPETGTISYADVHAAYKVADKLPKGSKTLDLNWRFRGPDNVGGRTRGIAIDINDTAHIVVGGVSGGIWESFDAGQSWEAYDPDFKIQNVSTIAQSSDGTFFVGTGSVFDGSNDDKGNGSHFVGNGLFRLTGNGQADTIVSPSNTNTFGTAWTVINKVVVDPNDPKRLLVATNDNLTEIKLDENGDGNHAIRTLVAFRCYDVEISKDEKISAAFRGGNGNGRIEYSRDNGETWTGISFPGTRRMDIAMAWDDSDIQYASAGDASNCLFGVYKTTDGWQSNQVRLPDPARDYFSTGLPNRCQGFYDQEIIVFPDNSNKILVAGVTIGLWNQSSVDPAPIEGEWQSYAANFDFGPGARNPSYVHSDVHRFVFNPENSNTLYIGSDGGIGLTFNANENRPEFSQANLGYNITQFYDIAVGPKDIVLGGTQDNGSQMVGFNFNTGNSSIQVLGGDGFDQDLFSINPSVGIASIYYSNIQRIQGIGTSLGNSTLNGANLLTGDLLNLCGGEGAGLFQCSEVFYTVTTIWESFNHVETKDSVNLTFSGFDLPPIPAGTRLYAESKNSSPSAFGNYPDLDFDLYEVDTERLLTTDVLGSDLFPRDTINGQYTANNTVTIGAVQDTVVISYDSVFINPVAKTLRFLFRGGGDNLVNFEYGDTVKWNNVFADNDWREDVQQLSIVVDSLGRDQFGRAQYKYVYKEYDFEFEYQIEIPDLIQSTVAVCNIRSNTSTASRDVWISKDILKGADVNEPRWVLAANRDSKPDGLADRTTVITAEFSADGNHLFLGTNTSELFRVDNINDIDVSQIDNSTPRDFVINNITEVHKIEDFKGRGSLGIRGAITGIAIDPDDANNILVTFGNYGINNHVVRSNNALGPEGDNAADNIVTFELIDNGLPKIPVYDVIMDQADRNIALIATEIGVYATENVWATNAGDVVWTEENNGMGKVPAVALDQMTFGWDQGAINQGKIYVGTHGRGIFESANLVGLGDRDVDEKEEEVEENKELKVYPNPVNNWINVEAVLDNSQASTLRVFNIRGVLVREIVLDRFDNGFNTLQFDLNDLERGAYILQLVNGQDSKSARIIKH